jgi:mannosyltransferase
VLREVDAVHGLYSVVLRGWTSVTGDSIEAIRAFSAVGVGVAAASAVLLVARHQPLRVAVAAGLFTGIVPGVAWTSVDGRSYGWSVALAVLATLALDSACRNRRPRHWVLYGVVCLVACWWHLYLVLLVVAHGIGILAGLPRARTAWTVTAAAVAGGLAPLAIIAWHQRSQVDWLLSTDFTWHRMVLNQLTSGQEVDTPGVREALAVGMLVLAVVGVVHLWRDDRRWLPTMLGLWGGVPTLVAVGCAISGGGMHPRYVTFAVPAVAIAAVVGAASLPRWTPIVAVVAAVALVVVEQRAPDAKPGNLRAMAAAATEIDADAVYFTEAKTRSVEFAYPEPFAGLTDLSAPRDPEPDPFFPGVRDPDEIEGAEVAGLRILVYGTRYGRSTGWLRDLGCRREPVASDRHFVVTLYTCPGL